MNGASVFPCPSNATCEGGSTSFVCSNNYIKNITNNDCDPCPEGTGGLNCTTISSGYYVNGTSVFPCPSNATCSGSSNPFVCNPGYTINSTDNGCVECPDGSTGLNCRTALANHYVNGNRVVPCPAHSICPGGTGFYTCSNGYYVNTTGGTCDQVRVIVQPGNSQLRNTTGTPTIDDATSCTATGCTLLFKDPITNTMLPINPCVREGKIYDFARKKCISKCCVMSMADAKNDNNCKLDVITSRSTKNTRLCTTRPNPRCCANIGETNLGCESYWIRGTESWSAQHNATCAAGFTDYGIDSISEKRRKYLAVT